MEGYISKRTAVTVGELRRILDFADEDDSVHIAALTTRTISEGDSLPVKCAMVNDDRDEDNVGVYLYLDHPSDS